MKISLSEVPKTVGNQKWSASAESILIFLSLCSIGLLSMNECMKGRPSRPLHRDLQWSIVL
jgi:hypothetical protein